MDQNLAPVTPVVVPEKSRGLKILSEIFLILLGVLGIITCLTGLGFFFITMLFCDDPSSCSSQNLNATILKFALIFIVIPVATYLVFFLINCFVFRKKSYILSIIISIIFIILPFVLLGFFIKSLKDTDHAKINNLQAIQNAAIEDTSSSTQQSIINNQQIFSTSNNETSTSTESIKPAATSSPVKTTKTTSSNTTTPSKTYDNIQYGYEVQYPSGMDVYDGAYDGKANISPNVVFTYSTKPTSNSLDFSIDSKTGSSVDQIKNGNQIVCDNFDNGIYKSLVVNGLTFYYGSVVNQYKTSYCDGSTCKSVISYCTVNNGAEQKIIFTSGTSTDMSSIISSFKLIDSISKIHPGVVIGYTFSFDPGSPLVTSLELPKLEENQQPYQVYLWNGTDFTFYQNLAPGVLLTFPGGGVSKFKVLGINPALNICPIPQGFLTSLTFNKAGTVSGSKVPITNNIPNAACAS